MPSLIEVLKTRIFKSQEESAELDDYLKNPQVPPTGKWDARVYALNAEMTFLSRTLNVVQNQLETIDCLRRRAQNASTLTCRIPDTLLVDILLACRAAHDDSPYRSEEFLRTATATCHHWRNVALNTPLLWAKIYIREGQITPQVHAFLDRAQDVPLDITLKTVKSPSPRSSVERDRIEKWKIRIEPYLIRCHTLSILVNDGTTAESVFPLLSAMPKLQTFIWNCATSLPGSSRITLLNPDTCSPTVIDIRAPSKRFDLFEGERLFQGLKHLSLDIGDVETMRSALNCIPRLPGLRSLHWTSNHYLYRGDIFGSERLQSPSLQILQIRIHGDEAVDLIAQMEAPLLRHLVILKVTPTSTGVMGNAIDRLAELRELQTLWVPRDWFMGLHSLFDGQSEITTLGAQASASVKQFLGRLSDPKSTAPWQLQASKLSTLYVTEMSEVSPECHPSAGSPGEYSDGSLWPGVMTTPMPAMPIMPAMPAMPAMMVPDEPQIEIPPLMIAIHEHGPILHSDSPPIQPRSGREIDYDLRLFLRSRSMNGELDKRLKIYLNESCWGDAMLIPESYSDLALDYPQNIQLQDHNNEEIPKQFLPDWETISNE